MVTGWAVARTGLYSVMSFSTVHLIPSTEGSGVDVLNTLTPPISRRPNRSNCRPATAPDSLSTTLAHGPWHAAGGVNVPWYGSKLTNLLSTMRTVHDGPDGRGIEGAAIWGSSQSLPNSG